MEKTGTCQSLSTPLMTLTNDFKSVRTTAETPSVGCQSRPPGVPPAPAAGDWEVKVASAILAGEKENWWKKQHTTNKRSPKKDSNVGARVPPHGAPVRPAMRRGNFHCITARRKPVGPFTLHPLSHRGAKRPSCQEALGNPLRCPLFFIQGCR